MNGCQASIYGKTTTASSQKLVGLLIILTGLGPKSVFLDIGSGQGKPNAHVPT